MTRRGLRVKVRYLKGYGDVAQVMVISIRGNVGGVGGVNDEVDGSGNGVLTDIYYTVQFAQTENEDETAVANWFSEEMAFSALIIMNVLCQVFATEIPPAPTTPAPMCAHAMLV